MICLKEYKSIIITLSVIALIAAGVVNYVKDLIGQPPESAPEHLTEVRFEESRKWKEFTENLEAADYKHKGQKIAEIKNKEGIWKPEQGDFKEIYQHFRGYDLVPWQKADGTEMSPRVPVLDENGNQVIKPNGKPLFQRINLIPQWEQEFNNNVEKGEADNAVLEKLRDDVPSKINSTPEEISFLSSFIKKVLDIIVKTALAAVEIYDTFTVAVNTLLKNHIPNTGTDWTSIIVMGAQQDCALEIYGGTDLLFYGTTCGFSEGNLCQENTALSSANYEVSIVQIDGDVSDDTNTLACRIQNANNMYAVRFNETASDLYKMVDGVWLTIDTLGGPIADGSTVKLICDGTSISVQDDGVEILSAADSSHTATGKAGVGIGAVMVAGDDGSDQWLDNFTVNTLAAEPAPAKFRFDGGQMKIKGKVKFE